MPQKRKSYALWRKLSQLLCFFLFIFLFIKTDYAGTDEIPYAVNILFRIDPLLAICASLAARTFITLMLPALATVILTLVLGRFFCGWICPMGALIDAVHRLIPPKSESTAPGLPAVKYYLLFFVLAAALFNFPLAGFFDPFSILVRGLALSVYPALNDASVSFFTFTYQNAPDWINAVTEPVYAALKHTVLPFRQSFYDLAFLSFGILATVLLLERFARRFFCRFLCPLGALLALVSRFTLLKGHGGTRCGKCTQCRSICRMGAIDDKRRISSENCNLCLDCVDHCPGGKISFRFAAPESAAYVVDIKRRNMTAALVAGAGLALLTPVRSMAKRPDPYLIRPPGALSEPEFLGRCVRCGECMKVCIGNALQPTFLEAGLEGMFSPVLKARVGYCEYNCTLCGQVCPSGAISSLSVNDKIKVKIGHAFFDKNRCLPYAKGIPCIVCEEHCPTPDKAIKFRQTQVMNSKGQTVSVRQPYLVDELCIGCGICENKCPLPGASAVRVTSAGESRHPSFSYLIQ